MSNKSTHDSTNWSTYREEFRPFRRSLVLSSILAALAALVELAVVYLLAQVATAALSGSAKSLGLPSLGEFTESQVALLLVLLVVFRGLLQLGLISAKQAMIYRYEQSTRIGLLRAFLDAEWATQSSMESTDIYNAIINYLNQGRLALKSLAEVVGAIVSFVLMLVGSFVVGGLWVFAILGATSVLMVLLRPLILASRSAAQTSRDASRSFVASMVETIDLAKETRVFGVDQAIKERNDRLSDALAIAYKNNDLASARLAAIYTSAVYLLVSIGLAVTIALNLSDPAPYIAVVLLLYRGLGYGQSLQSAYQTLVSCEPALTWLRQTNTRLSCDSMPRGGISFVPPTGSIEFESVSFTYDGHVTALKDVSFALAGGDSIGVIGPSGSGKSTLVQLLLRLRLPTTGEVLVNGIDLAKIDPSSYFGHVVLVPQEARLANTTILDNVVWYREGVDREHAVQALRDAHVLDELEALPDGLDTIVGEDGGRLSGGQRQRVCIARALAGNPDVLILDEPTSALDLISEERVRLALQELKGKVTLVIVAHRLSTLRICDRVMVLRDGSIEAIGSRSEVELNPFFATALNLTKLS